MSMPEVLHTPMKTDHPAHPGWFMRGLESPPQENIDALVSVMHTQGVKVDGATLREALACHAMAITAHRDASEKETLLSLNKNGFAEDYLRIAGKRNTQGRLVALFARAVHTARSRDDVERRRPGLDLGGVRGQYGNWGALQGENGFMELLRRFPVTLQDALLEEDLTVRSLVTHGGRGQRGHKRVYSLVTSSEELQSKGFPQIRRRIALVDGVVQLPGNGNDASIEVFLDSRFAVVPPALDESTRKSFQSVVRGIKDGRDWETFVIGSQTRLANIIGNLLEEEIVAFKRAGVISAAFIPESAHMVVTTAKHRKK